MTTSNITGFLSLLLVTTLSLPAFAEDLVARPSDNETQENATPAGDSPPAPRMDLSVAPPPSNPLERSDYVHNGFYLRINVGAGILNTTLRDTKADRSANATSFALGTDLLVGGSPSAGFALGGGVVTDMGFTYDFDGNRGGPLIQGLVGPFFDAHPNNKDGWHLGVLLGGAGGSISTDALSSGLFGGGATAWGGYDIWAAPEWSVGFNLRIMGSYLAGTDASTTNFSSHLMITVLNH